MDWPGRLLPILKLRLKLWRAKSLKIQLTPQDLHLRALRRNQTRIVAIVPCATSENGKMIARSLIFGALESPSHFRSDLEEIRWRIAEFEWLKALAEASPFCRS